LNNNADSSKIIFRKTFLIGGSARVLRRYLLHALTILQRLNHPFFTSFLGYEYDPNGDKVELYTEFCEGGDLTQHVRRHIYDDSESEEGTYDDENIWHPIPLQEHEVWSITFQLAAAIAYLHHGLSIRTSGTFSFERRWSAILHRNIKPGNGNINMKLHICLRNSG
jgi:serine/threonine protein kinase